jgi:hypothetical protein
MARGKTCGGFGCGEKLWVLVVLILAQLYPVITRSDLLTTEREGEGNAERLNNNDPRLKENGLH